MSPKDYTAVRQDEHDPRPTINSGTRYQKRLFLRSIAAGLLAVSLASNAYSLYLQYLQPWTLASTLRTRYAGLERNIAVPYERTTPWATTNRSEQDRLWSATELDTFVGAIALPDWEATQLGLPHAQRWPWDAHRGVYILSSTHELHCIKVLREYINDATDGIEPGECKRTYAHAMHCLDVVRQSVMCSADDTPLYTGRVNANAQPSVDPRAGAGQKRMCRDWGAMMGWAREHSACYHRVGEDEVENYRRCPDGSRPWEPQHEGKTELVLG